jgi:hypothetical protein
MKSTELRLARFGRIAILSGLGVVGGCATIDESMDAPAPGATAQAQVTEVVPAGRPGCDEVYRIRAYDPADKTRPFTVPAGSELNQNLTFEPPWGDEVVQAIAFIPQTDNRKVVHHWGLYLDDLYLTGWAPGGEDRPSLPSDVGIELPRGAKAVKLNLHYFNKLSAEPALDSTGVDICVVKGANLRPKPAALFTSFGSIGVGPERLMAPAGAKDYAVTSTCVIEGNQPVHLLTASPHAHGFAVHMSLTATKAGQPLVLHDGPFLFEEQRAYTLPGGEVVLNPGDVVTTRCVYDNPTTKNIYFGESTTSEMCFIMVAYYPKGAFTCKGGGLFGSSGGPLRSPTATDHEIEDP